MTRKRPSKPTLESFLFKIESISPDYSFGLGNPRFDRGAYSEHAHTEIVAACLAPKRFAGRATTFTLLGSRDIAEELRQPDRAFQQPRGVGTLTMRGNRSEYLGSLPLDALLSLTHPIIAGGLAYISLAGFREHGTSAIRVNYVAFRREVDLDDY